MASIVIKAEDFDIFSKSYKCFSFPLNYLYLLSSIFAGHISDAESDCTEVSQPEKVIVLLFLFKYVTFKNSAFPCTNL